MRREGHVSFWTVIRGEVGISELEQIEVEFSTAFAVLKTSQSGLTYQAGIPALSSLMAFSHPPMEGMLEKGAILR